MRRRSALASVLITLSLVACSQAPSPAATDMQEVQSASPLEAQAVATPLTFTAFGDTPYFSNINDPSGPLDTQFKTLLQKIDGISGNDFTVHVGDFMFGGGADCDPGAAVRICNVDERKNYFWNYLYPALNGLQRPFNLTLGDNDWSDYEAQVPGEGLRTLNEVLRPKFFLQNATLGQKRFYVYRPSTTSTDPSVQPYVENSNWLRSDLIFTAIHVPGGNFYRGGSAEYQARWKANYRALSSAFYDAKVKNLRAVLIFSQAWPNLTHDYATSGKVDGYRDIALYLQRKIREFGKPVLFIHGDEHTFLIQNPASAGAAPAVTFPNLIRLEVPGNPVVGAVTVNVNATSTGNDMFTFTCNTAPGSKPQNGCTSW